MDDQLARWAASGALELTGRADGPPIGPPRRLLDLLDLLDARLGIDSTSLLAERAAISGLRRRSPISCGGGSRLLATADGWLALTLARPEDVDLVPAWLELGSLAGGLAFDPATPEQPAPFGAVATLVATRSAAALDERAALLGLPASAVGIVDDPGATAFDLPVTATPFGPPPGAPRGRPALDGLTVVDLSSLWSGPLAARLLGEAGLRVVKVESSQRPDGARRGPAAFYHRLNGAKHDVQVDFTTARGRADLLDLIGRADVVVESSRPRALEQLGVVATDLLDAAEGPAVWVSITGFGRAEPWRNRVAFGDVAAAAGGLVVDDDQGPCFVADAVADPLAGMVAAAATLAALRTGQRWLLDVAMAGVSAHVAGEPVPLDAALPRP